MPVKKSELYADLWKSCDALRGGMEATQYKDYILDLLFIKYISDRYADDPDGLVVVPKGQPLPDKLPTERDLLQAAVTGGSFRDMVALKNKPGIGDGLNVIFGNFARANPELCQGLTFADFNDEEKLGKGQEMVARLSKLLGIFENPSFDFSANRAEGDDILGDAYEYLMRNFATESGKSKGEFYTPAEVSRVMAKLLQLDDSVKPSNTVYDPTCGSGSLLLKVADEAPHGISIYGQENFLTTASLAKMNMILHGVLDADIRQDNTLSTPFFKNPLGGLQQFDFVVANPPFSLKEWASGVDVTSDPFGRFAYGQPPQKNGDYAFLLHILASLRSTGRGAVILPHGVLFRGNAEGVIRRVLVQRGYIQAIIGLPPNLFYGTGIPACILVLDKAGAADRRHVFMLDASAGFAKDGPKNRLREQDMRRITDVFAARAEVPGYSRMVPIAEIGGKHDFNLNLPRYLENTTPEDRHDLGAHLWGGIPEADLAALGPYWAVWPALRDALFRPGHRPGSVELVPDAGDVASVVGDYPGVGAFRAEARQRFAQWLAGHRDLLERLGRGSKPKALLATLADDLLAAFAEVPLVDKYDVYQHLMNYWQQTMQDDATLIAVTGWVADRDLVPEPLVLARYFAAEQTALEKRTAQRDELTRQLEELLDEHGGEEGVLAPDGGKPTAAALKKRASDLDKALTGFFADASEKAELAAEKAVLDQYLALSAAEASAKKALKTAETDLKANVAARYKILTEAEVKTLVLDDKWQADLAEALRTEAERPIQALTGRVRALAERYAQPLPALADQAAALHTRVTEHLARMGYAPEPALA